MATQQSKKRGVYWAGRVPKHCQMVESREITTHFIDGVSYHGTWYIMHPDSHKVYGRGLGTGLGQLYELQKDGRWLKIDG